jgi:hypothetical protein
LIDQLMPCRKNARAKPETHPQNAPRKSAGGHFPAAEIVLWST